MLVLLLKGIRAQGQYCLLTLANMGEADILLE